VLFYVLEFKLKSDNYLIMDLMMKKKLGDKMGNEGIFSENFGEKCSII
jgi:hypothetical protein